MSVKHRAERTTSNYQLAWPRKLTTLNAPRLGAVDQSGAGPARIGHHPWPIRQRIVVRYLPDIAAAGHMLLLLLLVWHMAIAGVLLNVY